MSDSKYTVDEVVNDAEKKENTLYWQLKKGEKVIKTIQTNETTIEDVAFAEVHWNEDDGDDVIVIGFNPKSDGDDDKNADQKKGKNDDKDNMKKEIMRERQKKNGNLVFSANGVWAKTIHSVERYVLTDTHKLRTMYMLDVIPFPTADMKSLHKVTQGQLERNKNFINDFIKNHHNLKIVLSTGSLSGQPKILREFIEDLIFKYNKPDNKLRLYVSELNKNGDPKSLAQGSTRLYPYSQYCQLFWSERIKKDLDLLAQLRSLQTLKQQFDDSQTSGDWDKVRHKLQEAKQIIDGLK